MDKGFIKLTRSEEVEALILARPSAFLLLTIIAFRARRKTQRTFDGREMGEAYIGDYESYGATEQIYRDDKTFLEENGLITTQGTNKGTIAKLLDTSIFDVNIMEKNDPENGTRTERERTENERRTTNKKERKKEGKNIYINIILDQKFSEFWENYPRKIGKPKAEKTFKQLKEADIPLVLEGLARYNRYWLEKGTELQYIPHPVTWLNQQRWLDELSSKNVDTHAEYLKKVHAGLV